MTTLNITDRIINLRKHKNLSQKDFADITEISRSTLSEVENRKNKPSSALIVGIAHAFGDVNIEWLLTGIGEMIKFNCDENNSPIEQIVELVEPLNTERRSEILLTIIEKRRIYDMEDVMMQLKNSNLFSE
jgi:transcriptional regulator with XRE-family HTH domain